MTSIHPSFSSKSNKNNALAPMVMLVVLKHAPYMSPVETLYPEGALPFPRAGLVPRRANELSELVLGALSTN